MENRKNIRCAFTGSLGLDHQPILTTMKSLRLLLTGAVLFVSSGVLSARLMRSWSNQELLDKSDLVVIATPTANAITQEQIKLAGAQSGRGLVATLEIPGAAFEESGDKSE